MITFPSDLKQAILDLKKQNNSIILAHFYQNSEIQDIADFVGDSLDLSRKALNNNASQIVFCGVKFMAEVAKILSPHKQVLIPDIKAGCSLEDSCKPSDFAHFRSLHPLHPFPPTIQVSLAKTHQSHLQLTLLPMFPSMNRRLRNRFRPPSLDYLHFP